MTGEKTSLAFLFLFCLYLFILCRGALGTGGWIRIRHSTYVEFKGQLSGCSSSLYGFQGVDSGPWTWQQASWPAKPCCQLPIIPFLSLISCSLFLSPFLSPTRLPFTLRSVYMCRVSEHVRAHSRVPPQRRGTSGACSDSVYLILLRHGFLLNMELGWQPASSSDSPVSAPHRACVISVCSHAGLVPWLMGF